MKDKFKIENIIMKKDLFEWRIGKDDQRILDDYIIGYNMEELDKIMRDEQIIIDTHGKVRRYYNQEFIKYNAYFLKENDRIADALQRIVPRLLEEHIQIDWDRWEKEKI